MILLALCFSFSFELSLPLVPRLSIPLRGPECTWDAKEESVFGMTGTQACSIEFIK